MLGFLSCLDGASLNNFASATLRQAMLLLLLRRVAILPRCFNRYLGGWHGGKPFDHLFTLVNAKSCVVPPGMFISNMGLLTVVSRHHV